MNWHYLLKFSVFILVFCTPNDYQPNAIEIKGPGNWDLH